MPLHNNFMRKTLTALSVTTALTLSTIAPAMAQGDNQVDPQEPGSSLSQTLDGSSDSSAVLSGDPQDRADSSSDITDLTSRLIGGTNVATVLGILGGIVGIFAVLGLIASGLNWAVQSRIIPNPLPGLIPNPPAPRSIPAPAPAPSPDPCAASNPGFGGKVNYGGCW